MIPRIGQISGPNARSTQGVKIHISASARRDDKSAIRTKMQPKGASSFQATENRRRRLSHTRRAAATGRGASRTPGGGASDPTSANFAPTAGLRACRRTLNPEAVEPERQPTARSVRLRRRSVEPKPARRAGLASCAARTRAPSSYHPGMPPLGAKERAELPDSAFAYIDSRGKRRLPINDAAHVRNALARLSQVVFADEHARDRARTRLLNAAKKHSIVPVGFITGQLRVDRKTPLPTGQMTLLLADIEGSTAL